MPQFWLSYKEKNMFKTLLLLYFLDSSSSSMATDVPTFGYKHCKCDNNITPTNSSIPELGLSANEMSSYGIGCGPHDINTKDCKQPDDIPEDCQSIFPLPSKCKKEIPSWCSISWCYIANETDCSVPFSKSGYYEDRFYSYAACGERNLYSSNPLEDSLQDTVLKVAYRVNSGGWLGSYHPDGNKNQVPMKRDDQWYGVVPEFIDKFAESSGANINMTEAPLWVYDVANFSSDFTNCVHAVSLGMLDFCVGMFSITTQRAMMTSFFTIETTSMFLVQKEEAEESFQHRIFRAFQPFTASAWLCTVVVAVFTTFILLCQEAIPGGINSSRMQVKKKSLLARFGKSIYLGLNAFLGGSVTDELKTWQGRGTGITLGMFGLIIISMYTANLTTILVSNASRIPISSIEDAIAQNVEICAIHSTLTLAKDLYPVAEWRELKNRKVLLESIADGTCKCGIMYLEDLEVSQSEAKYCDLTPVGLPILSIHRGIPLNPLKAKALNYHFHKLANNGVWSKLKQNGIADKCASKKIKESSKTIRFGILDLAGIYIICSLSTAFFAILSVLRWKCMRLPPIDEENHAEETSYDGVQKDFSACIK